MLVCIYIYIIILLIQLLKTTHFQKYEKINVIKQAQINVIKQVQLNYFRN